MSINRDYHIAIQITPLIHLPPATHLHPPIHQPSTYSPPPASHHLLTQHNHRIHLRLDRLDSRNNPIGALALPVLIHHSQSVKIYLPYFTHSVQRSVQRSVDV